MPHSAASVESQGKCYLGVTSVVACSNYRLLLKFENGEERIFDVTPLLGVGRFRELVSEDAFKSVRISFDTVEWANGLDIDPEYLYDRSEILPE